MQPYWHRDQHGKAPCANLGEFVPPLVVQPTASQNLRRGTTEWTSSCPAAVVRVWPVLPGDLLAVSSQDMNLRWESIAR